MRKIIITMVCLVAMAFSTPKLAFADTAPDACTFNSTSTEICNPIKAKDAKELLVQIIEIILGIIALVAVTVIVISGFRLVISQGNESQVKAARNAITYAIVGLAVSALAYSIIAIINRAITQ